MKTVAVWKRAWLPPSETFIRNQIDALQDWRALPFGVSRLESILSRESDAILFGDSIWDKIALARFRVTGRSPRVERFLRANDVSVVHAHFGSEAVSIWRQCRHLGIPLVVTLHGHDITAGPKTPGFEGWRYRRRLRRMFAYASAIVAVSEFIRGQALLYGAPASKTVVRYIGIPTRDQRVRDAEPKWDIAFVGRLSEKKGVSDLLQALVLLGEMGRAARVVIVGSGPLKPELRAFSKAHRLNVEFLGHQNSAGVRSVLAASRFFVAPSQLAPSGDAEGFGLVFLEAALAGLAVVAYRHGGVPEAVADGTTGLLCEEKNVDSLAEAIALFLSDVQRTEHFGTAGSQRVLDHFDVTSRTAELEQIYTSVCLPPAD